ncbi:acyl-CoA dehydrogenase family protein [Micromonospora aurantiaca]|uniref:acyl-CoA dehydrogenase family protein n=1 Tax=Micromonospora aurantiaca (nom. illeg.) TaxID=47850 RepID=UPI0038193A9F
MRFAFTPEQLALAETARRYLAEQQPSDAAGVPETDPARREAAWKTLGTLGWLDADLGAVEWGVLAEECGYGLHREPWLTTVALAGPALRAAGQPPAGPVALAWAEAPAGRARLDEAHLPGCRAVPDRDAVRLHGRKERVVDGLAATSAVVVARGSDGPGLYLADLAATRRVPLPAPWDATRAECRVDLAGVPAEDLWLDARRVLADTRRLALALFACEAVGIARRAHEIAVAHARDRVQFGRPIGANQAVSHPLAQAYARIETARSLAYRAAWCVAEREPGAEPEVVAAALAAREAALIASEAAIQTLGAAGFTWAHPAHRWYRRALWHQDFAGTASDLRAELAAMVLAAA